MYFMPRYKALFKRHSNGYPLDSFRSTAFGRIRMTLIMNFGKKLRVDITVTLHT